MPKLDKLDPNFIKEFLKTEGIDLDGLMGDLKLNSTTHTRVKLLFGIVQLLKAYDKYSLEMTIAQNSMSLAITEICATIQEVHSEMIGEDEIDNKVAVKVKDSLLKLNKDLEGKKD